MKNPFKCGDPSYQEVSKIDPKQAWEWIKNGSWELKNFERWYNVVKNEAYLDGFGRDGARVKKLEERIYGNSLFKNFCDKEK